VDVDGVDWDDALNKSLPRYRMVERKKGGGGWSASRGTSPAAGARVRACVRARVRACACVLACVHHACARAYVPRRRAVRSRTRRPAAARVQRESRLTTGTGTGAGTRAGVPDCVRARQLHQGHTDRLPAAGGFLPQLQLDAVTARAHTHTHTHNTHARTHTHAHAHAHTHARAHTHTQTHTSTPLVSHARWCCSGAGVRQRLSHGSAKMQW
jgi:hypothetical protein